MVSTISISFIYHPSRQDWLGLAVGLKENLAEVSIITMFSSFLFFTKNGRENEAAGGLFAVCSRKVECIVVPTFKDDIPPPLVFYLEWVPSDRAP